MTYRFAAYSILEKFKQLNDDRKISLDLVVFYLQVAANNIKYRHLKNTTQAPTGAYLTIFDDVTVIKNKNDSTVTLPASIMDLINERGIDFIAYQMDRSCDYLSVIFSRTKGSYLWRAKMNPFEKPSPSNPVFWRSGDTVHLEGIECVDVDKVIMGLYTTVSTTTVCDLDSSIPIDEQYMQFVLMEAEALLRFGYATTQERMNDGSDIVERLNKIEQQLSIPVGANQEQQQQAE